MFNNIRLASPSTRLALLSDVIPVRITGGVGNVYSIGDVLLPAGVAAPASRTPASRASGRPGDHRMGDGARGELALAQPHRPHRLLPRRHRATRHQNRRVTPNIERINITGPTFIEGQFFFLRILVPKNIFPKTLPIREQVHVWCMRVSRRTREAVKRATGVPAQTAAGTPVALPHHLATAVHSSCPRSSRWCSLSIQSIDG